MVGQEWVKKELSGRVFNHYNIVAWNARKRARKTAQASAAAAATVSRSATVQAVQAVGTGSPATNSSGTVSSSGSEDRAAQLKRLDEKQARNWYHDKFDSKQLPLKSSATPQGPPQQPLTQTQAQPQQQQQQQQQQPQQQLLQQELTSLQHRHAATRTAEDKG